jgi:hypothetical protein
MMKPTKIIIISDQYILFRKSKISASDVHHSAASSVACFSFTELQAQAVFRISFSRLLTFCAVVKRQAGESWSRPRQSCVVNQQTPEARVFGLRLQFHKCEKSVFRSDRSVD